MTNFNMLWLSKTVQVGNRYLMCRRRLNICQKIAFIGLISLIFFSLMISIIERYRLTDINTEEFIQENEDFLKEFVIIPQSLLNIKWRKEMATVQTDTLDKIHKNPDSVKYEVVKDVPGIVLLRPAKNRLNFPMHKLSQLENRRRGLVAYLHKLQGDFKPQKSSVNEYIDYKLVTQLPTYELKSAVKTRPIITLFTTFKHSKKPQTMKINTLVLKQWARLKPWVELVLFLNPSDFPGFTSSGLMELANSLGWKVIKTMQHKHGLPIVKYMYRTTLNITSQSIPFIAYANSDIMFDTDLVETLSFLWSTSSRSLTTSGCLLVGKRTPVSFEQYEKYVIFKNVTTQREYLNFTSQLDKDADFSFDYFITTRNGFKWDLTPDFVVGKPGYDAWLVVMAQEWNLFTVDLTKTVTAYHVVMGDNLFPEKGWMADDVCMNRILVDPFDYTRAHTHCARYFTGTVESSHLQLFKREKLHSVCFIDVENIEVKKKHYPSCFSTADIKRAKFENYKHIVDLIGIIDDLIKNMTAV